MLRISLILAFWLPLAAIAQAPPSGPRIELTAAGAGGAPGTTGEGSASVSGKIILPPGWKLSIHTLTIRHAKNGGATTLNALLPVKGLEFKTTVSLKSGGYQVWAVIDVKDNEGRERQISSDKQNVNIP